GYSGAELANVINEAALLAARKGKKSIELPELEEARDKVRWGKERRSLALSEKEKENTAYHEAGHAICLMVLDNTEPLHKVTIIPRGPSLGSTMWLPVEDRYTNRKNELLDNLIVTMGGRVAEEIVFGDVTNGAAGDIRQATALAKKMICEWGMSDELGMVEYGDNNEHVFLARDMARGRDYSEDTAQKIDSEVKRMIDEAYAKSTEILTANRDKLNTIAQALLEYETLNRSHIEEIMETGKLGNPPKSPKPPELPKEKEERKTPTQESSSGDEGFSGDLAGAPA
ncbi:MAG: cell division protein FtsH, partial [Verrucomicrobiae bacterium]|nr:cell division protein FtsH [Verrucomicrobiae bacterium]